MCVTGVLEHALENSSLALVADMDLSARLHSAQGL